MIRAFVKRTSHQNHCGVFFSFFFFFFF